MRQKNKEVWNVNFQFWHFVLSCPILSLLELQLHLCALNFNLEALPQCEVDSPTTSSYLEECESDECIPHVVTWEFDICLKVHY
jgi:hypothetical protein